MEADKTLNFKVNGDVAEKFELALLLNKEDSNKVVTRMMKQYIADSFSRASKRFTEPPTVGSSYLSEEDSYYAKANRKIPTWARKPQQNNHRIVRAFFEIEEQMGMVTVDALSERCSSPSDYPDTYTTDFKGNFAQMKTDASNSHGKVFVVDNDVVEIWNEVIEILLEYKDYFTGDFTQASTTGKITEEMVEVAYLYAMKVYSGEMTRSEGKAEIVKITGMNGGSAQDFITDFLAMMEGKEYHRTMSNLGTSYFLENIEKDFGIDALKLALEATEKHIKYYNSLGYGQLKAKEEIVKKYRESLARH